MKLRWWKKKVVISVGGIFTADPMVVSEARLIKEIDYEEMLELSSSSGGASPINARAVEMALVNNVSILVTGVANYPNGTLIHNLKHSPKKEDG